jgi:hypothetical protein
VGELPEAQKASGPGAVEVAAAVEVAEAVEVVEAVEVAEAAIGSLLDALDRAQDGSPHRASWRTETTATASASPSSFG